MVYFFFYNNLNNTELLKNIHPYHKVKIGYIYVSEFDRSNNKLVIYKNKDDVQNTKTKLYGLFVYFELTLEEILQRLEKIDKIKYKNRNKYILDVIKVYLEDDNMEQDAYIIY